ncbi:3-dehydroquinate synthase [Acinetobacter qingfengensis]|uniref:3-dehydroquinate synthase n=1 Tax=Acinetobacter qingfengensis TaxID=1262585 RepID=A0A1E7R198_9GAMM|nr:3-dehydroquinate synthase [Acinetobacter qingfengensis]KAA8733297.1 3-dehydroquinate synthase [Acinetobacter qingfengensis]OEY93071.1 3-dehydroquinate synthase [Acinetobacter qingfengensis]
MQTLFVELGERRYPIFIGHTLDASSLLAPYIKAKQVMIVTNTTVAALYLEKYTLQFEQLGKSVATCILPDGEKYKDFGHLHLIFDALLQAGFNRDCTIVALGGGVIGDMAGYAAASFQRGVNFIQIPTTLLSQVDSSVGGKTGINHPLGKNMIGAFKQPEAVIADMAVLDTLPPRELSAGMAEVIKYALLCDAEFLLWLEQNMSKLMAGDADLLAQAVYRCCAHKARIVANDETEKGERALLNLGHTFGHAIESYLGYGTWLHGEAVATGMVMAAELSARQGWIDTVDVQRIQQIILAANLPIVSPAIPLEQFLNYMSHDKKVLDGQLRLILLKQLGKAVITNEFDQNALIAAIQAHQQAA